MNERSRSSWAVVASVVMIGLVVMLCAWALGQGIDMVIEYTQTHWGWP